MQKNTKRKGNEKMKEKLMKLPKWLVAVLGLVLVALFLLIMNGGGAVAALVPAFRRGYTMQCIAEIVAAVYTLAMLFLFGYGRALKETGVGFVKGFYVGGFMTGYCFFAAVAMFYVQRMSGEMQVQSFGMILIYILTMFLVGLNEEVIVRGVVLNLLLDRFSNTRKGVLGAVLISSLIFGCAHIPNVFSGVPLSSALIQSVQATLLGVLFAAIYLRSGNLWICIILHAATDFAGLMASGIFGNGEMTDMIGNLSLINLVVTVPLFLVPCLVLLRKSKLEEIACRRRGENVVPTVQEAENTATVSLVLGVLSIVMGCSGYTLGIGVAGLLGAIVSKRMKPQENGVATAGMVVAIVGIVFSLLGIVFMMVMLPMMGDMQNMENFL